jgi:hypothetical protein
MVLENQLHRGKPLRLKGPKSHARVRHVSRSMIVRSEASLGECTLRDSSKQTSDFNVPEGFQGTPSGTVFLEHSKTGVFCRKFRPDSTGLDSSMTIVWPPNKHSGGLGDRLEPRRGLSQLHQSQMTPARISYPCGTIFYVPTSLLKKLWRS